MNAKYIISHIQLNEVELSMVKTKIIKGRPIYVYRRRNYMDKPDKAIVSKMKYDEVENVTKIYCKKPKVIIEFLCTLIILLCVYLNLMYINNSEIVVHYNNIATYYNGKLYLNLYSEEDNIRQVHYSVKDDSKVIAKGVLMPGDVLISVPIKEVSDTYEITFEYYGLLKTITKKESINVIDRSK